MMGQPDQQKPAPERQVGTRSNGTWRQYRLTLDRLTRSIHPYIQLARLDRPIGIWLLLAPCWWGVALAAPTAMPPLDVLGLFALFACGAVFMRGAGCTINDIFDRSIDAQVARTASRPVASGRIGVRAALLFFCAQCLVGLMVLIQFNPLTILLGLAVVPLVILYPLAKRYTQWPQLMLGLTFNWGVLMGWSAVHGSLAFEPVLLYLAALFWTLGYDTIYACQDKRDDAIIGVGSTALYLGRHVRTGVGFFYTMMMGWLVLCGYMSDLDWPFFLLLAGTGCHLAWQVMRFDPANAATCLGLFRANQWVGVMVFLALVAG